jgi:signal transduction histidine kinase
MPPGPRYQALRMAGLRGVAAASIRHRPMFTLAMGAFVVGCLTLARYPVERIGAALGVYGVTLVYQLVEARRVRTSPRPERDVVLLTLLAIVSQALLLAITGGLRSPLVPQIIGLALGIAAAFGRSRESHAAFACSVVEVIVLAALPERWLGPPIARPWDVVLTFGALFFSLAILRTSLFAINDAWLEAGRRLDRMREEVLVTSGSRARSLETIGAKVAHELKNPLAAIKGLSQLLARSPCEERTRERIGVMRSEIERMEGILRDYLSFARPLDELRPEEVDLGAVAEDVVQVASARALAAGIRIALDGSRPVVVADPTRLKEALLNLVSNAIEATPPGGAVVVRVEGDHRGARIDVVDNGRGMTADVLARVGTPYFTTRDEGTGLGVLLARTVALQHGGELRHASTPGAGTTATLTLAASPPERVAWPPCGGCA